jgi:ferrous iron transport protein A
MNLWDLPPSTRATVKTIATGLTPAYRKRLSELGLQDGEVVECVRHVPFGGPRIYKIGDCVYSIARDIAAEVEILPTTDCAAGQS